MITISHPRIIKYIKDNTGMQGPEHLNEYSHPFKGQPVLVNECSQSFKVPVHTNEDRHSGSKAVSQFVIEYTYTKASVSSIVFNSNLNLNIHHRRLPSTIMINTLTINISIHHDRHHQESSSPPSIATSALSSSLSAIHHPSSTP